MVAQVVRRARLAVGREVGGGRAGDEVDLRDAPRDEAALLEAADAQRHVDALGDEVHDPVVQPQVEFDRRVAPRELGQRRQQQVATEGHRHVHAQPALRLRARAPQRFLGVRELVEDAARALQVVAALGGEADLARRAVEQPRAEVLLERRDVGAGRRTRDVEFVGGLGEGAAFGHAGEDADGGQLVHALIVQDSRTDCNDSSYLSD